MVRVVRGARGCCAAAAGHSRASAHVIPLPASRALRSRTHCAPRQPAGAPACPASSPGAIGPPAPPPPRRPVPPPHPAPLRWATRALSQAPSPVLRWGRTRQVSKHFVNRETEAPGSGPLEPRPCSPGSPLPHPGQTSSPSAFATQPLKSAIEMLPPSPVLPDILPLQV